MTPTQLKEAAQVMLAAAEGKQVQFRFRNSDKYEWEDVNGDDHEYGELRRAAEAYLWELSTRNCSESGQPCKYPPPIWPWDESDFKPTEDIVRQLVKAGALIAAEIDRLERFKANTA